MKNKKCKNISKYRKPEDFLKLYVEADIGGAGYIWSINSENEMSMVAQVADEVADDTSYKFYDEMNHVLVDAISHKLHNCSSHAVIPSEISNYIVSTVKYDRMSQMIYFNKESKRKNLLQIRGWGEIQHSFQTEKEAAEYQDSIGDWIVNAINKYFNLRLLDV